MVSELVLQGEVYAHEQPEVLTRIAAQCDGNPLFAELMVDVFAETGPEVQISPTIHALLSARLDQLPADERQLLDMAAVIGRDFPGDALEAMAAGEGIAAGAVAA